MRTLLIIAGIFLTLALLIGCGEADHQQKDVMLEVAHSFDYIFNTNKSKGQEIFSHYCSVCHGLNGQGDGFNAYNLNPSPRNFSDPEFIQRLDSSLIVETITGGGRAVGLSSKMPPWGNTLTETDIRLVSSHVISLSQSSKLSQ